MDNIELIDIFFVDENYSRNHPHMLHHHDNNTEILYIAANSGRYIVGDYEYAVKEGDIVICNPGIAHGEDPFQEHLIQTYCFVFNNVDFVIDDSRPIISLGKFNSIAASIFPNVYKLFHADKKNYETCLHLALGILFLTKKLFFEREKNLSPQKIKRTKLLQAITNYINKHYRENLTLKKISEEIYISENYISHLFKRETGITPMQYLMQRRLGEAQSLLTESNRQIAEIADSLGFNSDAYFSKMFKKYVKVTPKEYRQYFLQRFNS